MRDKVCVQNGRMCKLTGASHEPLSRSQSKAAAVPGALPCCLHSSCAGCPPCAAEARRREGGGVGV
eukprot:362670-Chlamydomonas_euryale.AAC.2